MDRAALGLRWGIIFASPAIGFDILAIVVAWRFPEYLQTDVYAGMTGLVLMSAAIILSGRWWSRHALRTQVWMFPVAALVQGFLWMFVYLVPFLFSNHWTHVVKFTWNGLVIPFSIGTGIFGTWSLLLGLLLRWRISRAYKKRLAQRRTTAAIASRPA